MDAVISTIPALAFSTALSVGGSITDTAGNTGSQTSSTLIRAIAVNEVSENSYKKAMKLEMKTSLMLGGTAAVVGFFRMFMV